ncbi:MAG: rhodanese-like domain-containing protein [Paludibaculum sp.]
MCTEATARISRRGWIRTSLAGMTAVAAIAAPPGWNDADLIQPADFAKRLGQKDANKIAIFHVGFGVLYRGKHIPNSTYVGPCNKPEGIELLRNAVAKLPKDQEIVIYCGCCPWDHCPNMKPALAELKQLGFKRIKALMIPTNFSADWIQLGYPVEYGQG